VEEQQTAPETFDRVWMPCFLILTFDWLSLTVVSWDSFYLEKTMNSQQWRQQQFKVFFLGNQVFLYQSDKPTIAYKISNDRGRWMNYNDLTSEPWKQVALSDSQQLNFQQRSQSCYCGSGGVNSCDFCTGIRQASISKES